jgi:hypothetical protein
MKQEEISKALTQIAFSRSTPFCMGCYLDCPENRCKSCHSDDLARKTSDNLDWGTSWIVDEILENELTAINTEEEFEQMMEDCYPATTQVAWMNLNTISIAKEMDPTSWRIAADEWTSSEWSEGLLFSHDNGSTFYRTSDIEDFIQENSE